MNTKVIPSILSSPNEQTKLEYLPQVSYDERSHSTHSQTKKVSVNSELVYKVHLVFFFN